MVFQPEEHMQNQKAKLGPEASISTNRANQQIGRASGEMLPLIYFALFIMPPEKRH